MMTRWADLYRTILRTPDDGAAGGAAPAAVDPATALYGNAPGDKAAPGAPDPVAEGAAGGEAPGAEPAAPADPAGEKPAEGEGEKPAAEAVKFDPAKITLPEGMTVNQGALDAAAPVIAELGLTQEQGQKLIDVYTKLQADQAAEFEATMEAWRGQVAKDPEVGGAKFEANVAKVQGLVQKFGDPELADYLASSGAGNNPAVFRFVARLAAAIGEDVPVRSEGVAAPAATDPLTVLYGSTNTRG